jgi:hypothetical protein
LRNNPEPRAGTAHAPLDEFERQVRDIYVPAV